MGPCFQSITCFGIIESSEHRSFGSYGEYVSILSTLFLFSVGPQLGELGFGTAMGVV